MLSMFEDRPYLLEIVGQCKACYGESREGYYRINEELNYFNMNLDVDSKL
jgi:hypothetical protein